MIDKSHGSQPFVVGEENSRLIWVMNSEVYNHVSITNETDEQYHIETTSDSSAIGYLYRQYGEDKADLPSLVRKMDGKFAFILYDERKKFLIIGRDHMGLCPLYWGHNKDGSIYISSELKAIEGLCEDYTYFPPGHCYSTTGGLQKWYDPDWQYEIPKHQNMDDSLVSIK